MIEESQVVMHEGDQPNFIGDLLDADVLPREDLTEVYLSLAQQMRPQWVMVTVRSWKG
jgi:hypothetical protein